MISSVIIGVVTLAVALVLLSSARSAGERIGNLTWVRWGVGYRAVGVFGIAVMIAILVDGARDGNIVAALVAAFLFGLLAVPVFVNGFLWGIGFGEDGLRCQSAWRGTRVVSWGDITGASFSVGLRQWVVSTRQQGSIRLNELANGSAQFLAELRRRGIRVDGSRGQ